MLDHVSISHQSGLILYQKSFTPTFAQIPPAQSPINALFRDALIEGKVTEDKGYEKDGFSVRWTVENGLGLVFVVVFPALLPLTYIQTFLTRIKQLYLSLFHPYLQSLVNSLSSITAAGTDALAELKDAMQREQWERILLRCLRNCEGGSETKKQSRLAPSLSKKAQLAAAQASGSGASTPGFSDAERIPVLTAEEIAKNVAALKDKGGGGSAKGGKAKGGRVLRSGSASPSPSPSRKASSNATAKLMRKWNDTAAVSTEDMAALDFSSPADENLVVDTEGLVSEDALGTVAKDGSYEVADWDFRRGKPSSNENDGLLSEDEIIARGASRLGISAIKSADEDDEPEAEGLWASMFSRIKGNKVLTADDLKPVLGEMEKHLMSKNVAKDIAEKLCEGVGAALAGKKLSGFSSIKSEVQAALSSSITRILTPKTSTDLLLDIRRKRAQPSSLVGDSRPDPFTITFVGVNGVGKSTNLSKVCFWLLQNKYRVLIAACDTFRSGAVEQLRVHVRNLGALGEQMGMADEGAKKRIELYERGYGKDAAGIAKDAIAYAKDNEFDVVLIDTAGRMQDNEPLMRALAKLVSVNNPDKLVFVGEALVGNEAVDQLSKFDRALKDFSGPQRKRGIDGIILTKFDTIDDKVGAALSMTYVTGQPILFVGCGQTYTDLRHLRVNHITQALLSS